MRATSVDINSGCIVKEISQERSNDDLPLVQLMP